MGVADLHRRHNKFNVGDDVMIRIRPEWYSLRTNKKLHVVLDDTCFIK